MDDSRADRVREIVQEAAEFSAAKREAYLAQACQSDEGLRDEVARRLAKLDDELPAVPTLGPLQRNVSNMTVGAMQAGDRFGRFAIRRLIGSGGFGEVYLAERDDVSRQLVALKILRRRLPIDKRRAEVEIASLVALGGHPNIVALLDVDVTADGMPMLVMEYVAGVDDSVAVHLDDHCAANQLGLEQRLRLLIDVCHGLEHCHEKLIVHRDIKPSNILVGALGAPKLADFGIAKLLAPGAADVTTNPEQRAFSLAYASPEQLEGLPIGVASDIYSLGVVAYAILAGGLPYSPEPSTTPARMAGRIRSSEPRAPSRLLSDSDRQQTTVELSERPHAVERFRTRRLSGGGIVVLSDLDAVVLKALRAEPRDRYPSVRELRLDLERLVAGSPVWARPLSRRERLGRAIRRSPATFAAILLAVVLLVGSVGGGVFHLLRTSELLRTVTSERNRKEELLRIARRTADEYLDEMREDPRLVARGLDPLHRKLLEDARDLYRFSAANTSPEPSDPTSIVESLLTLAIIEAEFHDFNSALRNLDEAAEQLSSLPDYVARDPRLRALMSAIQRNRGQFHLLLGNTTVARGAHRQAIEELRDLDGQTNDRTQAGLERAIGLTYLGEVELEDGSLDEATSAFEQSERIFASLDARSDRATEDSRRDGKLRYYRSMNQYNLGIAHLRSGRLTQAEPNLRAAQAGLRTLVDEHPDVPKYRSRLARSHVNLASLVAQRNDAERAVTELSQGLRILRELGAAEPHVIEYQVDQLMALLLLVNIHASEEEARKLVPQAEELASALAARRLSGQEMQVVIDVYFVVGIREFNAGAPRRAAPLFKRVIQLRGDLPEPWRGSVANQVAIAGARCNLALTYDDDKQQVEELRRSFEILRSLADVKHGAAPWRPYLSVTSNQLVDCLRRLKQDDEAREIIAATESLLESTAGAQ